MTAKFYGTPEEKKEIHSREEMDQVLKALDGAEFSVTDVKKGERTKKAPLPFTTSTLQQEASKVLNFSTSTYEIQCLNLRSTSHQTRYANEDCHNLQVQLLFNFILIITNCRIQIFQINIYKTSCSQQIPNPCP